MVHAVAPDNLRRNRDDFRREHAVIIDMIVLRGDENDGENFKKLSQTKKFMSLDTNGKIKTLEKYFDVNKLFGKYEPDTLPTEYLGTYVDVAKIGRKKYQEVE